MELELLSVILAGLLTVTSPIGLVVDKTVSKSFKSQFYKVEDVRVRIESVPTHQLLQGKVDKIQVAAKGIWITPDIRVQTLEIETDPLAFNTKELQQVQPGNFQSLLDVFQKLPQAGLKLVFTEKDINQALKSPKVKELIKKLLSSFSSDSAGISLQDYDFKNMQVKFLGNNRASIQMDLEKISNKENLALKLEAGIEVLGGRKLQLTDPNISVDDQPFPAQFFESTIEGINQKLDLKTLEEKGILARVLKLNITNDSLEMATFIKLQQSK